MLLPADRLQSIILKTGFISEKKLEELVRVAKDSQASLEDILIENDIISDENLGRLIAEELKTPFVILAKISIPEDIFHIIPESIARKHKLIPFARDKDGVKLAMADPTNITIIEMITKKVGERVIPYLATQRDIYNTLRIYQKDLQKLYEDMVREEVTKAKKLGITIVEAPVTKIVDAIITYAYHDRASDIHLEAEEKDSLVRFRIDGILHDMLILPHRIHEEVIARIKVLSKLRTDEHLSPQDGKMHMKLEEEDLDIRVSIIPMINGEKAVLRLLASRYRQFSLVDLGMNDTDLQKVNNAFSKSYGMILSTGPTGSGKTTSVYAVLKILNTREKNITTIEDPVEYRMKGVNQIQVNVKTNLTFASGLRSILRQDPNIIFVGEIRDNETAGIAVNAALTGHLVLSTLHTNDAVTALPRLVDMKVEPFLVASTVNVIVAQRLIRKICEMCKTSFIIKREELLKNIPAENVNRYFGDKSDVRIYKGEGCKICHTTGYAGRLGIFEVLELTPKIRTLIAQKSDVNSIVKQAIQEGMTTMLDDGLNKVAKGVTTIEEIFRVTKVEML